MRVKSVQDKAVLLSCPSHAAWVLQVLSRAGLRRAARTPPARRSASHAHRWFWGFFYSRCAGLVQTLHPRRRCSQTESEIALQISWNPLSVTSALAASLKNQTSAAF